MNTTFTRLSFWKILLETLLNNLKENSYEEMYYFDKRIISVSSGCYCRNGFWLFYWVFLLFYLVMTDKELKEKILAEIERRKKFYYDRYIKKGVGCIEESRYDECVDLLDFINSLPKERPYKTGDKVWYLNELYTLEDDGKHYILTSVRDNVTASVVHLDYGCEDFKLLPCEEPVSEDLEEAIKRAADETKLTKAKNGHPFFSEEDFNLGFSNGAQWQKANLWKPADGDDLPEIDREVIALLDNGKVVFAHRPPEYWDGKDIVTGKVTRNYPKTYDKGGWNIPNIVLWLDVELPKEIE